MRRLISLVILVLLPAAFPVARQRVHADLILTGGTVVTMDAERRILAPGAVAIRGATIAAVGPADAVTAAWEADSVIDTSGQVVLPGLINTHGHAPMVLYRGLADDLALMEWLERYIFPAEAKTVSPAMVRTGTRLAALEMIRTGTTTFVDMYYFEEEVARAAREAGLRGVLGQTVIRFPVPDAPTPAAALERARRFLEAFAGDPLVTPAVAPHAAYTLDRDALVASRDLAAKHGAPLLIHLSETEDEVRMVREQTGQRPVAYLEALGLLGPRLLAAHAVWLDADEIALLRRHGVGVSHNPESNMKLASGVAPVPAMIEAGVAVGLGTDGAASNNDLDMFEAMRQAALLHKVHKRDPRVVPARTALAMATIDGARALGMADRIGSIEPGKLADLIVVDMTRPGQTPLYDPVSHLVYTTRGTDVRMTIVNGRVLMRDRQVLSLDETQVLREAREMASRVRAAVAAR